MNSPDPLSLQDRFPKFAVFLVPIQKLIRFFSPAGRVCPVRSGILAYQVNRKKKRLLKIVAGILVVIFSTTQVTWGQEYLSITVQAPQAVKDFQGEPSPKEGPLQPVTAGQPSHQFLENTLTLTPGTPEEDEKPITDKSAQKADLIKEVQDVQQPVQNYEYERYDFSDAAVLLRPEYATAVILKDLTAEDLEEMVHLPFETGILVLRGEIVLFTSGSQDEIGVLPAVKTLTERATFISHTHPSIYSEEGPSGQDINEAVGAPAREYVITHKGVYAYNNQGVMNGGKPYSYEWYLERIGEAVEASKGDRDQVEARADLNQFIAGQDRYNEATDDERITFRRGGTLSPNPNVNLSNISSLSKPLAPWIVQGANSLTQTSVLAGGGLKVNYDVSQGGTAPFSLSFDDPSTLEYETADWRSLGVLRFGIASTLAPVLQVRIIDQSAESDIFTLTGINPSATFYELPLNQLAAQVNLEKIAMIEIIVDASLLQDTQKKSDFTVWLKTPAVVASPFLSPFNQTLASGFTAGTLTDTGIVVSDGKYLYVKPWKTATGSDNIRKVGTGLQGTERGKDYGWLASVSASPSMAYHSDGFIYNPITNNSGQLQKINVATGVVTTVSVAAGLIGRGTGLVQTGAYMIASDGTYLYNVSYRTGGAGTYNGWTVRILDPSQGLTLVREYNVAGPSFQTNGILADGENLYFTEWTGTNTARVAVSRISDGTIIRTWSLNQADTKIINGSYDWVNRKLWVSGSQNSRLFEYEGLSELNRQVDLAANLPVSTPLNQTLSSGISPSVVAAGGNVATDGKYLYLKIWKDTYGNDTVSKIGTGYGGTVRGQNYGTFTSTFVSSPSMTYLNGYLYNPTSANQYQLERIDVATGLKSTVPVPAGLIERSTGTVKTGWHLITSDGRYLYNVAYRVGGSTTNNGWTVRIFDPLTNFTLVKEYRVAGPSFDTRGIVADGEYLYFMEWTGTNTARVVASRISDGAILRTWTLNQADTSIIGAQYDPINKKIWFSGNGNNRTFEYESFKDLGRKIDLSIPLSNITPFNLSPASATLAEGITGAGSVATDGKYLYVKRSWSNAGSDQIRRIGTGYQGTVKGKDYGVVATASHSPGMIHVNGFLYNPLQNSPNLIERIDPNTGMKINMSVSAGLIERQTGKVTNGWYLLASDGRYVYNVAYKLDGSTAYNGWRVRVLDPLTGFSLVREFNVAGPSFETASVFADGEYLYFMEYTGTNAAPVAAVRLADGVLVKTWTNNQQTTWVGAASYDPINRKVWSGSSTSNKIYELDGFLNNPFPSFSTELAESLVSVTTQDGLLLKYDQGNLVAIEKPGEYQLYQPKLDANGNLTDGILLYTSGVQVLIEQGRPTYQLSALGEKTFYQADGLPGLFVRPDGIKIRFQYRYDLNKVSATKILESSFTSLYQNNRTTGIRQFNGTKARYDSGFLREYWDVSGNFYQYLVTEIRSGTTLTGYKVKLEWVKPVTAASALSIATILSNLSSYPTIKTTLETDLALEMEYDAQKNMTKVTSGKNEVLTLSNELPTSLKDSQGVTKLIQSQLNAKGDLESLLIQESGVNQSFDGLGKLSDVRLSDGTVLEVRELKVNEVVLSDGSVLSGLKWNGTNLTDFLRTKVDGTKETHVNSRLIRKEEPNGNVTTYFFEASRNQDRPNQLTTKDGRTYKFIEYTNAQGLVESLTELTTVDLPDGNQIQFEKGKPIRYIQKKEIQLDPYEVPVLPAGKSFVPSVKLAMAEMRSLTIDQNATILSGEILFNDGTQYIIKDGDLFQQITPDGRLIEFSTLPPVTLPKPDPILGVPLTSAETAYKTQLIEAQLNYFRNGVGLDALTGLPLDNFKSDTGVASDYSQATLVGFWAEILSAIARKDYTTTKMSQLQAFQKLLKVLTETRKAQQQAGWNGMLAFFKIVKTTTSTGTTVTYQRQFDSIGIGDNLNMSLSLATVIGALNGITLDATMNNYRNQIIAKANEVLMAQDAGYAQYYDSTSGRFRMARVLAGPKANTFEGTMDRVFNEFRSGLVWLAARNSTYKKAVDNLDVAVRPYKTDDGKLIDVAVPFDGGAFQMFWPLIHVDETKYAEFDVALKNFLYAQAEYVKKTGVPGLVSAGDDPLKGYNGKMGLKAVAETDDPLVEDVGSLYATASAFLLAPHYALQLLKNIETKYPAIKTSLNGYIDSLAVRNNLPVYSKQSFGVDQASFMLSLMKTSQIYFDNYLKQAGLATGFDSVYKAMSFGLNPAALANPPPPAFGANPPTLYTGSSATPDGRSPDLLKQPSFLSTIFDPDFGEGKVFNYINPDGKFHHIEIEFGEGANIRRMSAQEYLLLPGRGDFARTIFEGIRLDLLNEATSSGVFYTPNFGYANGVLTLDSTLGEVRRLEFDFRDVTKPVGLWHQYVPPLDLSKYDYISVPVRLGENMPAGANLKFEMKGLGEIFVTTGLTKDWQYLQIPVIKPAGLLNEIAIVVQSPDGKPFTGEFYLGPISAFKVRTSKSVDWLVALGKTDSELRTLLKQKVATQAAGGGTVQGQEVLENFLIDAGGKLVEGTLKLADGSIQYFNRGRLNKWVFKNGRTVLFERGLASFVLDLAKGKLEQARFYYDANFKGQIKSFIVQDNDRKRVFAADGSLQTMVDLGSFVNMKDGKIDSIVTSKGTLTQLVFADDGSLLKAHVKLTDGREFDIDNSTEQVIVRPNGVKIYYKGNRITAIETPGNGKTTFAYTLNALLQLMGVDATFAEIVNNVPVVRTLSIFDYLQRPERSLEKGEILREAPRDIIPLSSIGGFSVGPLPSGEVTWGRKGNFGYNSTAWYQFKYNTTTGPIIGMASTHTGSPSTVSNYDFIKITLQQDPAMTWAQDFNLKLKSPQSATLYNFQLTNAPNQYQSFGFPLAGKSGSEGEVTLEVVRESAGVGKTGTVYIKDISYFSVKTLDRPLWENEIGLTAADLLHLKIESGNLVSVGAEVASGKPLLYPELVPMLDLPSWVRYTDKSATDRGVLLGYKRFDGAEVNVTNGTTITKVTLPDGTVNEYSATGNTAQNIIKGPDSGSSTNPVDYHYGALRKVTQADGRTYEFTYEFDTDGKEITVVKDSVSGDERRFKEGKLLASNATNQLQTRYSYEAGEISVAELTYKNRVLESTRYHFTPEETQVTDERGTIWYYDAGGNLTKHLTKDGYLFEYSADVTQTLESGKPIDSTDYKYKILSATDLKAVRFAGYETADGAQLTVSAEGLEELKLPNGDHGVNLVFDKQRRIKSGQIQFADGAIFVIENYVPVSGRRSNGQTFTINFPAADSREILLNSDGSFQAVRVEISGKSYFYNLEGKLVKASYPEGRSFDFTYTKNTSGQVTAYQKTETARRMFRGVPYPKKVDLKMEGSGASRMLRVTDGDQQIGSRAGSGFVLAILRASTDQWEILNGTFASSADRFTLKNTLTGIKQGDYVAFEISDSAFASAGTIQEREDIFKLLEGLGAGKVRQAASASNDYFLFGIKGLAIGEAADEIRSPGSVGTFSSETKTITNVAVPSGTTPTFDALSMLLNFPMPEMNAFDKFLKETTAHRPDVETQAVSVYNSNQELVFTRRLDGVTSYYENGKVREVFDETGELLYTYEYDGGAVPAGGAEGRTTRIRLVKSRTDFEAKLASLREKIEQEKFDALYKLAWQDEAARLRIKEEVENGLAQIDSQISSLESQRFQDVKQCGRGFLGFGKKCKHFTIEVPGVAEAINNLRNQRSQLLQTQEAELAKIPGQVAAKKQEVEDAVAAQLVQLNGEADKFRANMLHQEMEPILNDFFRRILGRDPSSAEVDSWVNRYKAQEKIDTAVLATELTALPERQTRLTEKQTIISQAESFLRSFVTQTTDSARQTMLNQVGLGLSETVSLDSGEVDDITSWLKSRDLHFGQSAFLALKDMLENRDLSLPMTTIGVKAVLIDILTGVINRFTEGELLISVFALQRTAKFYGHALTGVNYSHDDLLAFYAANSGKKIIAHVGEDHFVVITSVTATEVTYKEMSKGASGEIVTVSKEDFLKTWQGDLIVPTAQAITSKQITDKQAQQIRGAFFPLLFLFAAFLVKAAVAIYTAVTLVISTVFAAISAVLTTVIQAISFVFAQIVQGISAVANGLWNVAKLAFEGVKYVGRFLMKGFQFLKEGFQTGLQRLGQGISQIKDFLLNGAGKPILDAGGKVIGHEFTTSQVIARSIVSVGLNYSVTKGLEGMGLNPTLARLGGAFVGLGFMGIGAGGAGFLKSGLQGLLLQGVSEMGLKLNLPPPVTSAISLLTSASLNAYFDKTLTLKQALKTVVPTAAEKLTLGGLDLIGRSLGLDWRITALIGIPIGASVGGLVSGVVGAGGSKASLSLFESVKKAVFSSKTLGAALSLGASVAVDSLNIPSVLKQFGLSAISGIASVVLNNLSPNADPKTSTESILRRLSGNLSKFGSKIIGGLQNAISFGSKVLEGAVSLTKTGFAKAVDFFSGIFSRNAQETIRNTGSGSIEQGILSKTVISGNTARAAFNGVDILWDQSTEQLTMIEDGKRTATFYKPGFKDTDKFTFARLAYAEEIRDGITTTQDFEANELKSISIKDSSQKELLKIQAYGDQRLRYDGLGELLDGQLEISNIGTFSIRGGQIDGVETAGRSGGFSNLLKQAGELLAKPLGYVFSVAEKSVLAAFNITKGILSSMGTALDNFYGTIIDRNAKDLWTPQDIKTNVKVPTDLTAADADRLFRETGGRLPDGSGYAFRASEWTAFKDRLPPELQQKLDRNSVNYDISVVEYFEKQKDAVVFFGDTTKLADHYVQQFQDPNLARRQILGNGEHNVIERGWFGTGQILINDSLGMPDKGLAEIRIVNTHLTDIFKSTNGFVIMHRDEGANAFLSGITHHIFAEVLPSKFKRKEKKS